MFRPRVKRRSRFGEASTPVRRRPSLDFSLTGLVYSAMMLFMGLAAINSQANLLFGVFGLMIGVLLVSVLISRMVLHKIQVRRLIPETSVVGQPVTLYYEFTNEKRFWPSLSVSFAELEGSEAFVSQPVAYMLHAGARMTSTIPTEVVPKRRGRHQLDRYQVSTSFPFGFIKRASIRREIDRMMVYPPIGRVSPRLLALCRAAEKAGPTVRPRQGGVDEFYGVRPYRTGDNPRWIYWRRSARTDTLVMREMTRATPPRLVVLVDSFLSEPTTRSHALVERTIAMAASIVSFAAESDLLIGLFCWSDGWQQIEPQRGKRQRRELLGMLAQLPLNDAHDSSELLDHARQVLRADTTALLVTPRAMPQTYPDRARGNLVVLSSSSGTGRDFVHFGDKIDFRHCMPAEQDPSLHPILRPSRHHV